MPNVMVSMDVIDEMSRPRVVHRTSDRGVPQFTIESFLTSVGPTKGRAVMLTLRAYTRRCSHVLLIGTMLGYPLRSPRR